MYTARNIRERLHATDGANYATCKKLQDFHFCKDFVPAFSHPAEGRRLSWPEQITGHQPAQGCLQWTRLTSKLQISSYNNQTTVGTDFASGFVM